MAKILSLEKLLKNKYDFFGEIVENNTLEKDQTIVAQEITNGLYLDAISESIQYIEDLFALSGATKNPAFFIKNIITYNAGQITNSIRSFNPTEKAVSGFFHFPNEMTFSHSVDRKRYEDGKKRLVELVK